MRTLKFFYLILPVVFFVSDASAAVLNYNQSQAQAALINDQQAGNPEELANYFRIFFLLIFFGAAVAAIIFLAVHSSRYYSRDAANKEESFRKMVNSMIGLGLIIISLLGVAAFYPDMLSFGKIHIPEFIKASLK